MKEHKGWEFHINIQGWDRISLPMGVSSQGDVYNGQRSNLGAQSVHGCNEGNQLLHGAMA